MNSYYSLDVGTCKIKLSYHFYEDMKQYFIHLIPFLQYSLSFNNNAIFILNVYSVISNLNSTKFPISPKNQSNHE